MNIRKKCQTAIFFILKHHLFCSNVVRVKCAECSEVDLCVECFSGKKPFFSMLFCYWMPTEFLKQHCLLSCTRHFFLALTWNYPVLFIYFIVTVGVEPHPHKANHSYHVIDNLSFPILSHDWGADEELLLLESVETYGLGNWTEVRDHFQTIILCNNTTDTHTTATKRPTKKSPLCNNGSTEVWFQFYLPAAAPPPPRMQVAEHVGTKSKLQCHKHYFDFYVNSPTSPLPDMSRWVWTV